MTSDFEKLSDLRNPVSKITGQSRFGRISNRLTIIALNTITNILRASTRLAQALQQLRRSTWSI